MRDGIDNGMEVRKVEGGLSIDQARGGKGRWMLGVCIVSPSDLYCD